MVNAREDSVGVLLRRGLLRQLDGPVSYTHLLLELSGEQLRAAIRAAATDKPGDKRLMDAFSGLSPLIALSLIHI